MRIEDDLAPSWHRDRLTADILGAHRAYTAVLPERHRVPTFLDDLADLLFPQRRSGAVEITAPGIALHLDALSDELRALIAPELLHRSASVEEVDDVVTRVFARMLAEAGSWVSLSSLPGIGSV